MLSIPRRDIKKLLVYASKYLLTRLSRLCESLLIECLSLGVGTSEGGDNMVLIAREP